MLNGKFRTPLDFFILWEKAPIKKKRTFGKGRATRTHAKNFEGYPDKPFVYHIESGPINFFFLFFFTGRRAASRDAQWCWTNLLPKPIRSTKESVTVSFSAFLLMRTWCPVLTQPPKLQLPRCGCCSLQACSSFLFFITPLTVAPNSLSPYGADFETYRQEFCDPSASHGYHLHIIEKNPAAL